VARDRLLGLGRDVLHVSGFAWFVASRLFVLTGSQVLVSLAPFYLAQTFGLGSGEAGGLLLFLVGIVAAGIAASVLFGVAGGTFLAVDWALLSELVPRDAAARFMGISNVATCSAGNARDRGWGPTDLVGGPARAGSGPRAALLFGAACYGVGVLLRRPGAGARAEVVWGWEMALTWPDVHCTWMGAAVPRWCVMSPVPHIPTSSPAVTWPIGTSCAARRLDWDRAATSRYVSCPPYPD
jgi:hypothetical protein